MLLVHSSSIRPSSAIHNLFSCARRYAEVFLRSQPKSVLVCQPPGLVFEKIDNYFKYKNALLHLFPDISAVEAPCEFAFEVGGQNVLTYCFLNLLHGPKATTI